MAKAKQNKETGLPVIIALVFFIVTTIGLGVFVYVLSSDQEAKDAQVKDANDKAKVAREAVADAENIARIYRIAAGFPEGTGNESDLVIVQNTVKEGTKPYQELVKLNAASKKRGEDISKETATKFETALGDYLRAAAAAGGQPPKIDASSIVSPNDFELWTGELDANSKQLLPPKRTLLEIANRAAIARNFTLKAMADERASYDKVVADVKTAISAYQAAQKLYGDKAVELPKSFDAKIAELNKNIDALRDRYQKNEAGTRAEIGKRDDQIELLKKDVSDRDKLIDGLKNTITLLNAKAPKVDPFAYDVPLGKITSRLADNIVEINLGSNAHVEPGLTFTVLPIDFPQKGRVSRMLKLRLPNERKQFKDAQMFIPKASIEVIEVIGPDVSRCRITSEHDDVRDRALPGDLLYNSVWRKGQADHIALVGIFDINGDGTDDIENVVRDFNKMGIPVDAYFDLKTQKWVGKLTERTRYLIDGMMPVPVPNDPNLDAKVRMIGAMKGAREEAKGKNMEVVQARDFFGRTGYKAKVDVSDDFINQAAARYLNAAPPPMMPPPGN